jgi:hypothetical protein
MLYKMANSEFTGKAWFNSTSASQQIVIIFKDLYSRPGTSPEDLLPHSGYLYMFPEHTQKGRKCYIFYSQRYSQNKQELLQLQGRRSQA